MNEKEKEIVVISKVTYNLCEGGQGGFGYINTTGLSLGFSYINKNNLRPKENPFKGKTHTINSLEKISISKLGNKNWEGRIHKEETKQKMRKSKNVGQSNSQFGTCWITKDGLNKKIQKFNLELWIESGWTKGRFIH
jgi:hypothetical protein